LVLLSTRYLFTRSLQSYDDIYGPTILLQSTALRPYGPCYVSRLPTAIFNAPICRTPTTDRPSTYGILTPLSDLPYLLGQHELSVDPTAFLIRNSNCRIPGTSLSTPTNCYVESTATSTTLRWILREALRHGTSPFTPNVASTTFYGRSTASYGILNHHPICRTPRPTTD